MYETKIDDAIKQLQGGSVSAPKELALIALAPDCSLEQRHRVVFAIYAALDDGYFRNHKTDNLKSLPIQQALCLPSLATINTNLYLYSEACNTLRILKLHWPKLRRWVLHLKNDFVDQESVNLSFRLLSKKCIGDFLGGWNSSLLNDMFDTIATSPGVITTLVSLWRLEVQDRRFSISESADPSSQPTFHITATLDAWMSTFSRKDKWDWSEVLRPFGGEENTLAATALDHLQQGMARMPINYDFIIWNIHLITVFSLEETIRIPLLKQRSMTILTNVIRLLVDRYAITDQHSLIAKCLSHGYWYIRAYVESTEGLPWITQVVQAGLLSAMLSTEPWIKHLNGPYDGDWEPLFLLLDDILPKYSVYSSVLRLMIKQSTSIEADGLPGKLDKDGTLFRSWTAFEKMIQKRETLYNTTIANAMDIEFCHNEMCDKFGPLGSLKSCAACHHVNYCSKACQVYDWKKGSHQKYCHEIQFRREHYLTLPLSTLDLRFIEQLIARDVDLLRDQIQDTATLLGASPVIVELDYKDVPLEGVVGSIRTVPLINTCKCDAALAQKWNRMVKLALDAIPRRVLVRAFFPAGVSDRVKFQCLLLQRVLEGCTSSAEDNPESDSGSNETSDLVYSCARLSENTGDARNSDGEIR